MRAYFRDTPLSGYGAEGILDVDDAVDRSVEVARYIRADAARPRDRGNTAHRCTFVTWREFADIPSALLGKRTAYQALLDIPPPNPSPALVLEDGAAGPVALLEHARLERLTAAQVGIAVAWTWQFVGSRWWALSNEGDFGIPPEAGEAAFTLPANAVWLAAWLHVTTPFDDDEQVVLAPTGDTPVYGSWQLGTANAPGWYRGVAVPPAPNASAVALRLSSSDTATEGAFTLYAAYAVPAS